MKRLAKFEAINVISAFSSSSFTTKYNKRQSKYQSLIWLLVFVTSKSTNCTSLIWYQNGIYSQINYTCYRLFELGKHQPKALKPNYLGL